MRHILLLVLVAAIGCASTSHYVPGRKSASELDTKFEQELRDLKLNVYFGNFHAHHYMGYGKTNKYKNAQALNATGECSKNQKFPQDDGRPCRQTETMANAIIPAANKSRATTEMVDYFQMACDYAREQGQLDILFVTPHTKNNSGDANNDSDTVKDEIVKRHKLLKQINEPYGGTFLCGLGQEASSISAGNHLGILGQFRADKTDVSEPFFFPAGEFDKLYSQVRSRTEAGEKIILEMNHPSTQGDLYWGNIEGRFEQKGFKKEALNDYGLDDFQPLACVKKGDCPSGPRSYNVDDTSLRQTYANIRAAAADRFRLIEMVPTGGATSNAATNFAPVVKPRRYAYDFSPPAPAEGEETSGDFENSLALLYDYVFYLAMGFKLGPVANQDNHHMNYGTAGASRTGVLASSLSENDVLTALDKRLTFASEDKNAKVFFYADAAKVVRLMGDRMYTTEPKFKLHIAYQDPDPDDGEALVRVYYYRTGEALNFDFHATRSDTIRLVTIKDGVGTLPMTQMAVSTLNDPAFSIRIKSGEVKELEIPAQMGNQYLFVEYTQAKDFDKIWTAPVWIFRAAPPAR